MDGGLDPDDDDEQREIPTDLNKVLLKNSFA